MCENCEKKDKRIEFLKQQLNDLKIERFNQRDEIVELQNRIVEQKQYTEICHKKYRSLKSNILGVLKDSYQSIGLEE